MGKKGKKDPKIPNSISSEPLVLRIWLTPQINQSNQVSINVSHNMYILATGNTCFLVKSNQKSQNVPKIPNCRSLKPLVPGSLLIPQFNHSTHIYTSVCYNVYNFDHKKYPFWANRTKRAPKSQIPYLPNHLC